LRNALYKFKTYLLTYLSDDVSEWRTEGEQRAGDVNNEAKPRHHFKKPSTSSD